MAAHTKVKNTVDSDSQNSLNQFLGSFTFRLILLSVLMLGFISGFNVNIGAIGQGVS
jgi:hypothetical protein